MQTQLSEAVIAYANRESGSLWQQLFQRPYFAINLLADVPGAEMCGTLKNIVAVGAGIGDGLGVGARAAAGPADLSCCVFGKGGIWSAHTYTNAHARAPTVKPPSCDKA
eukprot:scaffold47949_cov21-Tisochrysis_lutea.AAC.5